MVGAGVVGVATAYELAKAGFSVRVLEASDEVCGPASASWGNACTVGATARTAPLSNWPALRGLLASTALPTSSPERAATDAAGTGARRT